MSIADHFDQTPDAGFVRTYDTAGARRQFQVSVVLIVVLAVAAFVLGMLVRFDEPSSVERTGPAKVQQQPVKPADGSFAGSIPSFRS